MEEILSKYKERLINLSGRNRSLVSKKLPNKRAFDLYKLGEFSEGFISDILSYLISREDKKFLILPDYSAYFLKGESTLEKDIAKEEKLELSSIDSTLDKEKAQELKEKIKTKYREKLEREQQSLSGKRDKLVEYSVSLRALLREITSIIKETGRNELYVGYPFVEGKLKDDTFVRAPLFMFPVSLLRDGDSYYLENKEEAVIYLNKVLLLAICKHNEIKVKDIETEFSKVEENFITEALEKLKENNIIIENSPTEVNKFLEYKKDTLPNFEMGKLKLSYNLVLGQFPIANSIYNDYEDLLQMDINNKLLEDLLKTSSALESNSLEDKEEHGKLSFSEEELYLMSALDYSQEKAVKLSNDTEELVIYGPPGTGKSQTIANIISNALARNKTVLMVSQKRAALDVIYNRLAKLNAKALLIHDTEGDKKSFYSTVAQSLEVLAEEYEEYEKNILQVSKDIDNKIEQLEKLAYALHRERPFGLTLQEMYSKTKGIKSREDSRYSDFSRFRQENVFKTYTYENLKEAVEGLQEKEVLSYKTYRDLLSKNPFVDDVDLNMSFMDIDELSMKVENIIDPIKTITDKAISEGDLYHKLMKAFEENCYVLTGDKLEEVIKAISLEKNGDLLKPINDGRWWSLKYWMNYSKNKKQEEANRLEYENRYAQLQKSIITLHSEIETSLQEISIVKKALNERVYNLVVAELLKGEDLTEYFKDVIEALHLIEEYKTELKTTKGLSELQFKIMNYALNEDVEKMKNSTQKLLEFIMLYHIGEIEKEEEFQKAVQYLGVFDKLVQGINTNIEVKQNLVREFILNKWNSEIETLQSEKGFKEFKRQANKKRALLPIRKYVEDYSDMILKVFPCFLLSPETVSEILPLKEKLFDIIIFDEASQMYVENAIPTIFRGNSVIIAGDDKQLRPNGTFSNRFLDQEEEEEIEDDTTAALEEESLLDLAKVNYKGVHLNYHYRSSFEELINFSNYAFYEGRLKISPNVYTQGEYGVPIERIMVPGKWINRANIEEAESVVTLVHQILKERKNRETIGVITFNISQKTAIEDLLDKKASEDSEFRELYLAEIDRMDENEDVSLFVKNIENVQGDERDIIIFSVAYAKNEKGRVSVNFGSLSQDGGENRLNVAISRAKKKIYVVTSIEPEELQVDNTKNQGPKLFKNYLQYVRAVSSGNKTEAENILKAVVDTKVKNKEEIHHDSDFEAEVYEALKDKLHNLEVHTQVGVSGYKIDLAIYDPIKSKYILGIECDGATYHSSKSARERDIHRQRYLESRGWKITRIWSYNWWNNPKGEVQRLLNEIKSYPWGE
ncbi:superfamily I DNA and/or RNA helicase/very-short-patch-repair endonuclease [Clostridium punense]|uniref:Superfamily I DNA and/or RNA helicase/very-short-patch-repair endonuclease n=1 Tax=Clostridium punense TaxID=1054297 RepID=A0ABS4K140_9CLOT|nr:superfamily I DNA and/or RNA helicase/very-short-patch-repair endonuclease [Clostridium punense]